MGDIFFTVEDEEESKQLLGPRSSRDSWQLRFANISASSSASLQLPREEVATSPEEIFGKKHLVWLADCYSCLFHTWSIWLAS